ncbi:MAG: hypothetical protein GF313_02935 [Caldithrix sp.]|nr:hypothetical protein [Caldithrix sp.]
MKCNTITEYIPALIQKELSAEKRLTIIGHLRDCPSCREQYLFNLKLQYNLEKELVGPHNAEFSSDRFLDDLKPKIGSRKQVSRKKVPYYIAAAAALLILVISSALIFFDSPSSLEQQSEALHFNTLLRSEDWPAIQSILADAKKLQQFSDDRIDLTLLQKKIKKLTGREESFFAKSQPGQNVTDRFSVRLNPQTTIVLDIGSLTRISGLLEKYKYQNPEVTLQELLNLLNDDKIKRSIQA